MIPLTKIIVDVAAAIIIRADGSFLLGQRAPGTFYPGYWEFPGGKIDLGESPRQALVRELREELGIEAKRIYPWLTREFVYPHAHVRLHFFRVLSWHGELRDHIHTALAWQRGDALGVEPMLPANAPVLHALSLPDFYAVTHAGEIGVEAQLAQLRQSLAGGIRLVQIREPQLDHAALVSFARAAIQLARQFGARVLLNGDVQLAQELGADGVHLKSPQLFELAQRPPLPLVGASCHDARELARAAELELDFAVLGAVRPTPTHPAHGGIGWRAFARLIENYPLPVFAIGGLSRADRETAWQSGAHGIAAIRAA